MNLISLDDLSNEDINSLFSQADKLEKSGPTGKELAANIVALLFLEPSTRTRLSFDAAAQRLGAKTISVADADSTSLAKGETLEDTVRVVSEYSDAIVIRHPEARSAGRAAGVTNIPIINAGDGGNQHPTQTLFELYTIHKRLGRLDGLKIGFIGDHTTSRTIHSLSEGVARFGSMPIWIGPKEIKFPIDLRQKIEKLGVKPQEFENPSDILGELDVLYVNRIQKERWNDGPPPTPITVNRSLLQDAKPDVVILSPLPRLDELSTDVDDHPGAAYFEAVGHSVPMRMAILMHCLANNTPKLNGR